MKSSFLKGFTIFIMVLGIIGGIILGNIFKIPEFDFTSDFDKFNVALMFYTWIATTLYSIPLFAICSVLRHQEESSSRMEELGEFLAERFAEDTINRNKNN